MADASRDKSFWDAVQNLGGEILQPFVRPALSGSTSPFKKVLGNKSISLGESKLYDPNYGKNGLDADVAKDITGVAATLALGGVAGAAGGAAGRAGAGRATAALPKLPEVIKGSGNPQFSIPKIEPKSGSPKLNLPKIEIPKPGTNKGNGGDLFFPKSGGGAKTPLKPMPSGGGTTTRGGTTVVEAPPATKPDWNPLTDTKPFDPYGPKSNPWPGMPKIEPKPAPAKPAPAKPAPAPAPGPAPKTKTPKTATPWQPKSTVKPDAAKTKPKSTTTTEPATKTEAAPATNTGRAAAFATGTAAAIGLASLLPKPKTGDDKPWNPSSIV